MENIDLCRRLFNEAIANSPHDNSPESLDYGLEIAQDFEEEYFNDLDCGLYVSAEDTNASFACSQGFKCPLRNIVKLSRY
jgi:hypothetical protein